MEDQDNINEHLKNKLEAFTLTPRMSSFEEIQKKMEKKKRRGLFLFLAPGFFLILGIMGYLFFFNEIPSELAVHKENPESSKTKKVLTEPATGKTTVASDIHIEKSEEETINHFNTKKNKVKNSDLKIQKENIKTTSKVITKKTNPVTSEKKSTETDTRQKHSYLKGVNTITKREDDLTKLALNKTVEKEEREVNENGLSVAKTKETEKSNQTEILPNTPDTLELVYLPLTFERSVKNMRIDSVKEIPMAKNLNDSTKKEKRVNFFIGAAFNPQMVAYTFKQSKTNTTAQNTFSNNYLQAKKNKNEFTFNYVYGLKAGVLFKNKWEILAGIGFQKYTQKDRALLSLAYQSNTGSSQGIAPSISYNSAPDPNAIYKSVFKYYDFSLELAKIYTFNRFFKVKTGLGVHAQKFRMKSNIYTIDIGNTLQYDAIVNNQLSSWIGDVNLKAGLIEDITKTIQFQVCPNVFYSPTSMFKKSYAVNQKNYGFGLECLLLFRLR